jgi:Ca2+-binding EF-hand superfamily protein
MDADGTGYINVGNITRLLGDQCDATTIDRMMLSVDVDNDGSISLAEFVEMMDKSLI